MYFPESGIILRSNPEYTSYIERVDTFLSSLRKGANNQLNIEVVSDIIGLSEDIITFIFEEYCSLGLMFIKSFLCCPETRTIIKDIDENELGECLYSFCDICNVEHRFTRENLVYRYCMVDESILTSSPINEGCNQENVSGNVQISEVLISNVSQEVVTIAAIQLNYSLNEEIFPFALLEFDTIKTKVFSALSIAKENGANLVCLPELCIQESWIPDIKKAIGDMIVIAGSYYDKDKHNVCRVLANSYSSIEPQFKIKPSESEKADVIAGLGMVPGKSLNIYETIYGKFAILICRDFGNFITAMRDSIDIVFVPSYNPALDRFFESAHQHVLECPSYVIVSNSARYGGTSIFGQLDKVHFPKLVQMGYKKSGDNTCKLCELINGEEGIIMADFDIVHKCIAKLTPMNSDKVKISVRNIKKIQLSDKLVLNNP